MYLVPLGTLLVAGLGFPLPEEIPIVGAGALTGHQAQLPFVERGVHWWIMLPLLIIGVVTGDTCLFLAGRFWGQRLLRNSWVKRRLLPPDRQERIERNFERYGIWILLGARFMPGFRSPIFIMAGMHRLSITKFVIADGLYAIPGVSMLFWLAYIFTDQFVELIHKAQHWKNYIIMVVIAAVALYLIRFFWKHPVSEGDPKDVPIIGQQVAQRASHYEKPSADQKPDPVRDQPKPTAEKST